jgi:hypothetical protein
LIHKKVSWDLSHYLKNTAILDSAGFKLPLDHILSGIPKFVHVHGSSLAA